MSIRPRTLSTLMLLGSIALGAGAALLAPTSANAGDSEPCRNMDSKFAEVKAACKEGGRKAAKKLMNQIEKKAEKAGKESKCENCHSDKKTYPLTDNATKDYPALRTAAGYK